MNKKQAIERIQELVATKEINKCLEILRQPITLADFLGWEEDVIYVDENNNPYKITKDSLFEFTNNKWEYCNYYTFNFYCYWFLRNCKKAKKPINKKYYLKFKKFENSYVYYNKTKDKYGFGDELNCKHYQTQFTLQEIEKIRTKFNTELSDFEILEVQE